MLQGDKLGKLFAWPRERLEPRFRDTGVFAETIKENFECQKLKQLCCDCISSLFHIAFVFFKSPVFVFISLLFSFKIIYILW